jgi:formiminotetrahydrofolate cyclodeaminase
VEDLLDRLSDPSCATGGGSVAGLAAAMAAALGALVARVREVDGMPWDEYRASFSRAVLDLEAEPSDDAPIRAAEASLAIAEQASELGAALREALASCPVGFSAELETAVGLASAAVRGALATVARNIDALEPGPARTRLEARLGALQ